MSVILSPVAHALALASSLHGAWDCKPVGPAFISEKSVHSGETTSELLPHDKFIIGFERMSISEDKATVDLTFRGMHYNQVSSVYFSKGQLVLMVPVETGPDLRTFILTASRSGSGVRVEASFPLEMSVYNFGGVVGPDKIIGGYAIAAAVYECEAEAAA